MFTYCGNNPINYIDETGHAGIWYYLIYILMMPGYIHARVELEIKGTHPHILKETWIRKDDKLIGRADLVSTSGDVWEIKHGGDNPLARAEIAKKQAEKYKGGVAVRTDTQINRLGPAGAFSGYFTINSPYGETYRVDYDTPRNGVVLYYVKTILREAAATYELPEKAKSPSPVTQSVHQTIPANVLFIPIFFGIGGGNFASNNAFNATY